MIRLKKGDRYLDINTGEKIRTEWISTVFNDEDKFEGSYTYPITLPFTENNCTILLNADQVENRSARVSSSVMIEIDGQPWKLAKFSFEVASDGFDADLLIDNAEFAKIIKNKLLPEIFVTRNGDQLSNFVYDVIGTDNASTLATMLSRAAIPGTGSCVFFHQTNDIVFGGPGAPELPYDADYRINHYDTSSNLFRVILGPVGSRKYFYNPSYYLHWVIRQVCTYLGFAAAGEFMDDPAISRIVIDNPTILHVLELFGGSGGRVAPAKHLPKITIADFFKIIRATFKLAMYFDGNDRCAYFNYAGRIPDNREPVDISGFTEMRPVIKSTLPTGYLLTQAIDEADALFKTFEYIKNYTIGEIDNPQPLNNFAGTLFMTDVSEPRPGYANKFRVPRKRIIGNTYAAPLADTEAYNAEDYTKNEFSLRLLNYHGYRPDSGGVVYYYASSDGLEPDGHTTTQQSLWLNGLIDSYMKQWYVFFLRSEEVELVAHLPGNFIHAISPLKKIAWTTPTQVRMTALMNRVSFERSDDRADRISAKLRVYPVYNQAATDIKAYTEFTPGEIGNPGKIYVKFRLQEYKREEKGTFGGVKIITGFWCHGYLDFFSDPECTKAREVSSLPVNMLYNYRGANPRNYIIDQRFQVLASGTSHQIYVNEEIGIDQTIKYKSSSDQWQKTYRLIDGPDYIVVP